MAPENLILRELLLGSRLGIGRQPGGKLGVSRVASGTTWKSCGPRASNSSEAGPRLPAGGAAPGIARGLDRAAAQAAPARLHPAGAGRGRQHQRRGGPPACGRPLRPLRHPGAPADARPGPLRARLAQRGKRNLYASFAFRPRVPPTGCRRSPSGWGSISAIDRQFSLLEPGLKWPNDIVFDGRKAGGMLTEARVDADQIRDLVFALGLT